MPMHEHCLNVVVGVDEVALCWLGGSSLSSEGRCCRVVVRADSFSGRLHMHGVHAM